MTCGGLITIGLVLHLCTGAVEWNNFSWPLNIYSGDICHNLNCTFYSEEEAIFCTMGYDI